MKVSPVKLLRIKQSLSQDEAAERLGISRGYISQIETMDIRISDELKSKMAKLYKCNVKDLGLL